jgi:hypothetical protein
VHLFAYLFRWIFVQQKLLKQVICVATTIGDAVNCRKYVEDCPIIIGGKTLPTKLAVFEMLGFDVILGMDWLSKYRASIDCRVKEVIFRPLDVEEFKFCGSRIQATPPLIFAIQARKCVSNGAQAYLAYVIAKPEVETKLEDIPAVRDFLDVFARFQDYLRIARLSLQLS